MKITTPNYEMIDVAADGPVGRITLDRPAKLNPLSMTCLQELEQAARWFDDQNDVKVVIINGAGRAFTAGADLDAVRETDTSRDRADQGRAMAEAIQAMSAVTIAAIHGYCIGGGCVLVTACDLRVAAESAQFSIPEIDLGITLSWGGIPRLVREVGPSTTRDLVLSCRQFTSAEALTMGLVNRVVPDDELLATVGELASLIATKSAYTLQSTLLAVNAATEALVSTRGSWNEADSLLTALNDPESQAVGRRYLEAHGR